MVFALHWARAKQRDCAIAAPLNEAKPTMNRNTTIFLFVMTLAVAAACGPVGQSVFDSGLVELGDASAPVGSFDDSAASDASITSLEFDPPTATLALDGKTPQSAVFKLVAHLSNGGTMDVKAESLSFNRPDLAQTSGFGPVTCTASGAYAGVGTLQAIVGTQSATATLTITVHFTDVGAGVTPAAIIALDGATAQDPKLASLLYPYDATIFPLGLASPLVMWNAPASGEAYKIHYEETNYVYDGYFLVAAPAQLRVDQNAWDHLTASNQGDPLKLALARYDGTNAYQSAHEAFSIAGASLRGAIYYWTTSGTGHMSRIHPGTGSTPEVLDNGTCMGCHAVSADGSTLVATVDGLPSTDGMPMTKKRAWESFDLPNASDRKTSTLFGGNLAVNPDGKYTVFGNQTLHIADTAIGTAITGTGLETVKLDANMKGLMTPVFSPDGKHFAAIEGGAVQTGSGTWYHDLTGGKLVMMDFDEPTVAFSNLTALAPASAFAVNERALAYPTFTPDAQYIAFHVGDYTTGCNQNGCIDSTTQVGEVWIQNVNGTAPIKLTTLDTPPATSDANLSLEPTFNPIERGNYFLGRLHERARLGKSHHGYGEQRQEAFVGRRDRQVDERARPEPPRVLSRRPGGIDDEHARLLGTRGVHSNEGRRRVPSGLRVLLRICDQGTCVDVNKYSCAPLGDTCTSAADCCNGDKVSCVNGICAVTPVN